jgi:hypothetical protein
MKDQALSKFQATKTLLTYGKPSKLILKGKNNRDWKIFTKTNKRNLNCKTSGPV